MAVFAETGTYLNYGKRPKGKSRALLWPVLVYRVMYPEVRRSQLNLFQRAVLGLVRARTARAETIADLTGLHEDLVKLIFVQGISNGWLTDKADSLTEKGQQLLEKEEDSGENLKVGYIFQDAITLELWPRFETQLSDIQVKDPLAHFPEFISDRKTGKPWKPFVLHTANFDLPAPDTPLLMRAYKEYRDDYRASQQLYETADLPKQVKTQGMQVLDTTPRAARVLLWVTPDVDSAQLWSIKDPFGLRDQAWWLSEGLQEQVERDANLLKRLSDLIGRPQADNQTFEQWLAAQKNQTDFRMLAEYPWAERVPDIRRYLTNLLDRQERLAQGFNGENDLEAAVMECQKLLEVVMQWLIKKFPANVGQLPRKGRYDKQLNDKLLTALQIPGFNDEVTKQLSRQNLGLVIRTCTNPSSSLKALLFAAALGVLAYPQHPLKVLTGNQLQLEELLELADLRNQSSHGQSKYTGKGFIQVTPQLAQRHITYALGFTEHFKEWM